MYFLYNILGVIFFLISPIILFFRIINGKEDWRRSLEKYAYYNIKNSDTTVWFHGASVGEIMSILPLVNKFEKDKSIKKNFTYFLHFKFCINNCKEAIKKNYSYLLPI